MVEYIFAALCGPLDRLRGDAFHLFNNRTVDKVVFALVLAGATGLYADPVLFVLIALAMLLGMSPGWGTPYGAYLENRPMTPHDQEWWQVGVLKTNTMAALIVRGAMWGLPVVPLAIVYQMWSLLWFVPIFTVAFPLALVIGRKIKCKDQWAASELVRGFLVGFAIAILV